MMKISVVLTCYNRKSLTIACLADLKAEIASHPHFRWKIIVVDDGSTDGTSDEIARCYPDVQVLKSSGDLYWNRGMRMGMESAIAQGSDAYLWLNDDTKLFPGSLARMLDVYQGAQQVAARQAKAVIVGATCDSSGRLTYGGLVRESLIRRLSFRKITGIDVPALCDAMNGNCVLIPNAIVSEVGNLDPIFEHSMGDVDYGLRVVSHGFRILCVSGFVGECQSNPGVLAFEQKNLRRIERLRLITGRKALPWRSWLGFTKKHGGAFWPLYFVWPYLRVMLK